MFSVGDNGFCVTLSTDIVNSRTLAVKYTLNKRPTQKSVELTLDKMMSVNKSKILKPVIDNLDGLDSLNGIFTFVDPYGVILAQKTCQINKYYDDKAYDSLLDLYNTGVYDLDAVSLGKIGNYYSEKFFSFELDCCEDAFKYDEETILLMCSDFIKKHFGDKYNPGYVNVCVLKDGDEYIVKRYLKIPSTKKGFNLICVHG